MSVAFEIRSATPSPTTGPIDAVTPRSTHASPFVFSPTPGSHDHAAQRIRLGHQFFQLVDMQQRAALEQKKLLYAEARVEDPDNVLEFVQDARIVVSDANEAINALNTVYTEDVKAFKRDTGNVITISERGWKESARKQLDTLAAAVGLPELATYEDAARFVGDNVGTFEPMCAFVNALMWSNILHTFGGSGEPEVRNTSSFFEKTKEGIVLRRDAFDENTLNRMRARASANGNCLRLKPLAQFVEEHRAWWYESNRKANTVVPLASDGSGASDADAGERRSHGAAAAALVQLATGWGETLHVSILAATKQKLDAEYLDITYCESELLFEESTIFIATRNDEPDERKALFICEMQKSLDVQNKNLAMRRRAYHANVAAHRKEVSKSKTKRTAAKATHYADESEYWEEDFMSRVRMFLKHVNNGIGDANVSLADLQYVFGPNVSTFFEMYEYNESVFWAAVFHEATGAPFLILPLDEWFGPRGVKPKSPFATYAKDLRSYRVREGRLWVDTFEHYERIRLDAWTVEWKNWTVPDDMPAFKEMAEAATALAILM